MEISKSNIQSEEQLVTDLRQLIDETRRKVAAVANAGIATMYWHIGERINREILGNQRASYGKRIVSTVSTQLQHEFGGQEFSTRNLRRMRQFAPTFQNLEIVTTLMSQLPWSQFLQAMSTKDEIQREFYLNMAA